MRNVKKIDIIDIVVFVAIHNAFILLQLVSATQWHFNLLTVQSNKEEGI
ncbi:hypothetical protein [Thermoactinomyces mirandus]|uniref:Uncharacterized protein n=1 Tax=Thermoactinomyces mirandus TaxID=2756294 RepID=A0A7W1XRC8_9BACL|nr:hypothetical protein [Thermoactinomyces mirandus]MBA4601706.1 hypothetical protein [Thermoactinomyces mirandus]